MAHADQGVADVLLELRGRCGRLSATAAHYNRPPVKVLALDYGSARTGVAVSDPTGAIARPLGIVERVGTEGGMERLLELVRDQGAERVVVGMPLTLRGERGEQARETERFVARLRRRLQIPVESFDERLTTALAARTPSASAEDARAAAHLLESYLTWLSNRGG